MASFFNKGNKADALRRLKAANVGISTFRRNCLRQQVDGETLWTLTQLMALGVYAKGQGDAQGEKKWAGMVKKFIKNLQGPAQRLARLIHDDAIAEADALRLGADDYDVQLAREEGRKEGWEA